MRLDRLTHKRWYLCDSFRLTWRQRVALLFGRGLEVRFDSPDSTLSAACHLSWRASGEEQWLVSNARD